MRHPIAACVIAAALFGSSCGRSEQAATDGPGTAPLQDTPWAVTVEPLEIPAQGQSAQPHFTSSDRGVILSWLEHADGVATLKFAERRADDDPSGQVTWSPARTVASSDNWFVSWADVPTVMRMSDGTLVATSYPAVDPIIEAYDLRLSYSRDEGRTWAQPLAPHHDGTTTQHGFASLVELPDRHLGVVWLDGRDQELNTTDPGGGSMAVYFTSFDPAWTQSAETMVDARACECCQTAVVMTEDGAVAAFRDRSPREIRDIHVARLEQGAWTQPRPLHVDNWQIDACPVNGPALSARGRSVAAAWFTVQGTESQAYAAFSADAGRSWGEPIRLDDGVSLGHVDVELLDDGSAVATWAEFADQRAQFRMRHVQPSGARSSSVVVAGAGEGRVSGYPRLARQGDELVLAWTESLPDGEGSQQVKGAVARLPR